MTIKYRPRCFFDVELEGVPVGRIVLELFSDVSPITCENFRALCTGEKGLGKTTNKPLHYKGVPFHRVVKGFMVQCGDFSSENGSGGESIYGGTFKDECFDIKHEKPFLLSMANRGKDSNGSQFFITTKPAPHLDGIHVVFGHVISGEEIVTTIENQKVDANSKPLSDVRVANCGELVPTMKPKEKKRKRAASETTEEGESKSDSGSSSSASAKKKKKKKKRKKSKKHKKEKKREASEKQKIEEGEIVTADETVCSVKPEEIPDIPASNFLMRRSSPKDKGTESKGKIEDDDRRRRSSYQKRQHVSRSGRKIKGRGFMRYRTPSRSRSRSRSYTPPHWRQAQARVMPLSEYQKRQGDKPKEEESNDLMSRRRPDREASKELDREERIADSDVFSQNGDHESRKEVFDRESAAKENVSYPIKYTRSYEGAQSKWDSGDKQEWSRGTNLQAADEYSSAREEVKAKEPRKFVEEEMPKTDDEDEEIRLRNLALSHHLKAKSQDYGRSILQQKMPEETVLQAKVDVPTQNTTNWSFTRGSKGRKRTSSGSSSSSAQSEKRTVTQSVAKEKSLSPVRSKLIEHTPPPMSAAHQKESKPSGLVESSSVTSPLVKEAAKTAQAPEPKSRTESPPRNEASVKESVAKSSPRRRSSSGSPRVKSHKKSQASKSSPKRGKSKSSSPKRSSGRQRKKDSKSSPRRGRSSSGSPPSRSRSSYSRSSPRRSRRHSYRDSRRQKRRSRSQSSGSDADGRRQRYSNTGRRSRFSPRGSRQRRPYRRSRSDSSSGSRSPYRKPVLTRAPPKMPSGDKSLEEGRYLRKSQSTSSERVAASPRKDKEKSPAPKAMPAVTSPLPQRKLVQDYGSPSRHSDSSGSSKSPSKTPPDASTARRQAQIIAAYHEEEEEIEAKFGQVNRGDATLPSPVDAGRMTASKFAPLPDSPPPPPPGVEPDNLVLPPMPTINRSTPPVVLPPMLVEALGVQDMDLDEDEEEEKARSVSPAPPLPPLLGNANLPEEPLTLPAEAKAYAPPLPCSLEDILLPGEIRSDGQSVDAIPPRIPSPVEAVSMWKAIPEATQPTVEVSTLELLQKQMTEEAKPEPAPAESTPEKSAFTQDDQELKGEMSRLPEKRSPRSRSKDRKSPTRSKSRDKERKARRRSSSREKSRSKSRASRSRSRNRGQPRRKSRSSSRYRRSSRDSRERKRYRSRSRQRDRRRRSTSHSRSRSHSRVGGRRRRSRSDSRGRRRGSPGRGRRPTRYRPYIPKRSSSSRRRSPRKRSRRRSDSRSRSRSRSSSRSS